MMSGGTEGFKLISADDSSAVGRWRTLAATLVQGLSDGWLVNHSVVSSNNVADDGKIAQERWREGNGGRGVRRT